jgi:hypothetical protein
MHLVDRRKVKRRVITCAGKTCYRGYEYLYRPSKQGILYSNHLHERALAQQVKREVMLGLMANQIILNMNLENQISTQISKPPEPKILGRHMDEWLRLIPQSYQKITDQDKIFPYKTKLLNISKPS